MKRFGDFTAVDGLDLDVPAGSCLGLLGPNGAGKSTTMKLLTAQARADEGTIRVLGFEVPRESKRARAASQFIARYGMRADGHAAERAADEILTLVHP